MNVFSGIQIISFGLITFSFILLIYVYRQAQIGLTPRGTPQQIYISDNAASILTSVGVFFTFFGISIALFVFDAEDINKSVPELLSGLQLAFVSSVAGLFFAFS